MDLGHLGGGGSDLATFGHWLMPSRQSPLSGNEGWVLLRLLTPGSTSCTPPALLRLEASPCIKQNGTQKDRDWPLRANHGPIWDGRVHTYWAGVISDDIPLHSRRPGWGSKLYSRPGPPPALRQAGSPRGFCTQSPRKEGHLLSTQLPTLKISSFPWSPLHKQRRLPLPCQLTWSFLMALEAVAVASPTERRGRLWRDGRDHTQSAWGGQMSRSSVGRRKENRERKGSNRPSHLWKPLLLPRVTGRTKATTPFSPTFRSRELNKRGWWLL